MKYFLNIIISFLVFIILGFAWSFNVYLKQESPAKNLSHTNNSELTSKIKLFENYSSQTLRIAVLNGCGVSGVGNSYGNIFTNKYGLQVTRIENADNFNYEMTTIIILNKDNPNVDNILTILGTNINAGNVQFNSTVNPMKIFKLLLVKTIKSFLT